MQSKIIKEKNIILAGLSFYGDPFDAGSAWTEENQIGLLWQRLMRYFEEHGADLGLSLDKVPNYEVHIYGPETETDGLFEIFVGVRISDLASLPYNLTAKVLPPAEYAVFTIEGKAVTADWEREITTWLDTNNYEEAYPYNFQYYDERFKGLHRIDESQLDVYVPIIKSS